MSRSSNLSDNQNQDQHQHQKRDEWIREVDQQNTSMFSRFIVPLGIIVRVALSFFLHTFTLYDVFARRLEFTNALVSFRHVKESLVLMQLSDTTQQSFSPYEGLSCSRATPLPLWILNQLIQVPSNAALSPRGLEEFLSPSHLGLLAAFTVMDLLTAWNLFRLARDYYRLYPSNFIARVVSNNLFDSNGALRSLPLIASALFLLNPFTALSSVLFNLNHMSQLLLSSLLFSAMHGRLISCMILLGVASFLDLYPLILLLPVLALLHKSWNFNKSGHFQQYRSDRFIRQEDCKFIGEKEVSSNAVNAQEERSAFKQRGATDFAMSQTKILKIAYQPIDLPSIEQDLSFHFTAEEIKALKSARPHSKLEKLSMDLFSSGETQLGPSYNVEILLLAVGIFVATFGFLLYLSYLLTNSSWDWVWSSYGYVFSYTNTNPSYSLFWYFFTALFDRFHSFFLTIFHAHLLVYIVPLFLRFGQQEPFFLTTLLMHLVAIFKPYPLLPEVVFSSIMVFVLQLPLLLTTVRRIFPMVFLQVVSLFTMTLMQFLWLTSGSGNANFFFFQNLLYLFTQLFCTMECIGAVRRLQSTVMEGRVKQSTQMRQEWIEQAKAEIVSSNGKKS